MNAADIQFLSSVLKQSSGIIVGADKAYLIEARLAPIARKHSCSDVANLIAKLRQTAAPAILRDVVDAMTTNESFFFRDTKPFDLFRTVVLPDLMQKRASAKTLKIWCAAASTGQEPYSLAILLAEEAAKMAGWNCSILGTDLSDTALARAKEGLYTQFEAQRGLSIQRLIKNFDQEGTQWRAKPSLKAKVQYKPFNLLDNPRSLGTFDVVFCRNVLIYFDQATKGQVLASIASVMPRDGYLFLGGAETVIGISDAFEPVPGHHGLYRRGFMTSAPVRASATA